MTYLQLSAVLYFVDPMNMAYAKDEYNNIAKTAIRYKKKYNINIIDAIEKSLQSWMSCDVKPDKSVRLTYAQRNRLMMQLK